MSRKKYTMSDRRIFSPTDISGSHQCISTPPKFEPVNFVSYRLAPMCCWIAPHEGAARPVRVADCAPDARNNAVKPATAYDIGGSQAIRD
jgi:hypothetical protein